MHGCERFYRFSEFGREVVYDTEGITAFFLTNAESSLLDWVQEGKSLEESVGLLEDSHPAEEIAASADHLRSEGITAVPAVPYQEHPQTYALSLNLAQECNLRCRYCYVEKSGLPSSFMSEKTAKNAVDFLLTFEDMKGFGISFYGGEPLLNFPVMRSAMKYASREAEKRGFPEVEYHLTTNGTLLTDEIIKFLTTCRVNVMVSIDGPAIIHDAVRVTPQGEGTHSLVLNRLQKLLDTTGTHKVSASGVVTNQGRLKTAYEYLSQLPLKDIKLSYVRYLEESAYALTDSQKEQYKEDMREIALECRDLLLQGIRPPYYNFESNILQLWKHSKRAYFCPAGMRRFGISPEGGIYPCGPAAAMKEWKLGTLNAGLDRNAQDRWSVVASFEHNASCKKCWARYLCAGGCPLRLVRSSDEGRCEMNQHSTRLAIAIYAAVKEQNEMMIAALVDEEFLSYMREMLKTVS